MPGEAIVTINENQWSVSLATTYAELTTGLSGVTSMPAGTGMLFILPAKQQITVDTRAMKFALDIVFISDDTVIDVARNVLPGYLVTEETPCDSFLEVNAGEAASIEAGDEVSVTVYQPAAFDFSQIISFAMPLVALGFVCAMVGGMARLMGGSSSSSGEVRRLEKPRTEAERARVHEKFYGTRETPSRGAGLEERGESAEGRRLSESKTEAERKETHERKYGTKELPERGKGLESHSEYAPYIHEIRKIGDKVMKKYSVAATDLIVYEAWEPSAIMGKHSSITSIDDEWYGRIGTRHLPPELEKLPAGSEERLRAVGKWHEEQYEEAYKLIIQAFPEAKAGRRSMGEITLHWLGEHHSMWLNLEQRKELEKKYGMVAVRWAEEATKPGDIKAAERAAEYYYGKVKEALGLGHLSPELTEKQIRELRELLGLPTDVAEVLKIHKETGYIP